MSVLSDNLPAIATFLGGPVAGLATSGVEWLATKMGLSDKSVDAVKTALAGYSPDQLIQMKKMDIEFQQFCMDNNIKLQLAQIQVNSVEAASTSMFIAGWRPFVGWIGGLSLAYDSIVEPILRFTSTVGFHYTGPFPVIDTSITMQVLMALLGIAGMRSFEKYQGVEGNR